MWKARSLKNLLSLWKLPCSTISLWPPSTLQIDTIFSPASINSPHNPHLTSTPAIPSSPSGKIFISEASTTNPSPMDTIELPHCTSNSTRTIDSPNPPNHPSIICQNTSLSTTNILSSSLGSCNTPTVNPT
jgi:hypothetical protein